MTRTTALEDHISLMRISVSVTSSLLVALLSLSNAGSVLASSLVVREDSVCDPNATGPDLRLQQDAAFRDYARIFFDERDAKKAFDKYIPG
jgi:hypothetical protein